MFRQTSRLLPVLSKRGISTRGPTAAAIETAKSAAGRAAVVGSLRQSDKVIGIGSGSTVVAVVEMLAQDLKAQRQRWFIPTGWQSRQLIVDAGLHLGDIDQFRQINVTFDGADDVDANLNAIKGGGACHLREKVVCLKSERFVLVADWRKESKILGSGLWRQGVPIEIVPFACGFVEDQLKAFELVRSVSLRMGAPAKAGPVVTDNGNFILDVTFTEALLKHPQSLFNILKELTGVVEVGLFVGLADEAYFGLEDGTVRHVTRP